MTGRLSFFPWLRRGLATEIGQPASAAARATVSVSVTVSDGAEATQAIPRQFELMGPGDVIGIDPNTIVRTEPRNWITDFEPNYLAFIEFYEEDFPWRFTPRGPSGPNNRKLPPWLTLLVLKDGEFERRVQPDRPLPSVVLTVPSVDELFPDASELHAWAHVQLATHVSGGERPDEDDLDSILDNRPDIGLSRVLSPRKLDPNTGYSAFLIPTYDVGRMAGLGIAFDDAATPGTRLSWTTASEFPIYHDWQFRTGERGDFEELARRLVPRPADERVGIRDMDITLPGFGLPEIGAGAPHRAVGLEGALLSPQAVARPHQPGDTFPAKVSAVVNAPGVAETEGDADPLVAPPIYGRWHALKNSVDPNPAQDGWLDTLNRDARNRAAAGLGAEVVRRGQERYMKRAWEQIGEILAANRRIMGAQAAVLANRGLFDRSFAAMADEEGALFFAEAALARIRDGGRTVRSRTAQSRITGAPIAGVLRKTLRTRGPVAKRLAGTEKVPTKANVDFLGQVVSDMNAERATAQPPLGELTMPTLEEALTHREDRGPRKRDPIRTLADRFNLRRVRQAARRDPERFQGAGLSNSALQGLRIPRNFRLTGFKADPNPELAPRQIDGKEVDLLAEALRELGGMINTTLKDPEPRAPLDVAKASDAVRVAFEPERSFYGKLTRQIDLGGTPLGQRDGGLADTPHDRIVPAMACPDIKDPMYKPLADLGDAYFVPNLDLVPPNSLTLMVTNQPFIEAYMAGVNHEFCSELLFREYPTDQRCTAFRQFWSVAGLPNRRGQSHADFAAGMKDIKRMHLWSLGNELGENSPRQGETADPSKVVLVIRGDLLRRYPNTIVYAQSARTELDDETERTRLKLYDEDGSQAANDLNDPNIHFPTFKAELLPDLHFVGFDLTLDQVRGAPELEDPQAVAGLDEDELGKFFVIQEIVGEPRFGLDVSEASQPSDAKWDNMAWTHVDLSQGPVVQLGKPLTGPVPGENPDNVTWASNAADMASIFYQKPAMLAYHGREMLKDI